jgi:hypothetical protein
VSHSTAYVCDYTVYLEANTHGIEFASGGDAAVGAADQSAQCVVKSVPTASQASVVQVHGAFGVHVGDVVVSVVSFPGRNGGRQAAKTQVRMDPVQFLVNKVAQYVRLCMRAC